MSNTRSRILFTVNVERKESPFIGLFSVISHFVSFLVLFSYSLSVLFKHTTSIYEITDRFQICGYNEYPSFQILLIPLTIFGIFYSYKLS